jgi:predicted glycosyltransferase
MIYTGYLHRTLPHGPASVTPLSKIDAPYLLVTTGGGGDGEEVIDWVLRAYENDPHQPYPALLVLGPFMHSDRQSEFIHRASKLDNVEVITFDAQMEHLMAKAIGVVAMGGYNTFCEILSFDKRALIIPRTRPRMEQYLRATRAKEFGLVSMLEDDGERDWHLMATALRQLPQQALPSQVVVPGLLDGLGNINRLVDQTVEQAPPRAPRTRPSPSVARSSTAV